MVLGKYYSKIVILFILVFNIFNKQVAFATNIEDQIFNAKPVSMYSVQTVVDEMDTVTFGFYPQSGTSSDKVESIEWLVLERDNENHRALLFSKYILDNVSFNDEHVNCTWENSKLRKWLNSTFYDKAFSDEEKKNIVEVSHKSDNLSEQDREVSDKVFLLADFEARKYFKKDPKLDENKRLATRGTEYAKNVNNKDIKLWVRTDTGEHTFGGTEKDGGFVFYARDLERSGEEALKFEWCIGNSFYWLRTNGIDLKSVTRINSTGELVNMSDYSVVNAQGGMRPAIWVTYNKSIDKKNERYKLVDDMPTYKMGKYTQFVDGSDFGEQPIEWIILDEDKKNNRALLISKYILDGRRLFANANEENVTWETSAMRKWLNDKFYNKAFSDEEKNLIETVHLTNEDNEDYLTLGGRDTEDKIFLLSVKEAKKYFSSDKLEDDINQLGRFAATKGTDYAQYKRLTGKEYGKKDGCESWGKDNRAYFLRSPGVKQNYAAVVAEDAYINTGGSGGGPGIRPAMWIKYRGQ